jgi:hypothetical protein
MIQLWVDKLKNQKIDVQGPIKRFGDTEQVLTLHDPDGLQLELVADKSDLLNTGLLIHGKKVQFLLNMP